MSRSGDHQKRKRKRGKTDEDGEEYVVEAVVNKRRTEKGVIEYMLKWQGFSLNDATWEPEKNISCPGLIAEFNRKMELEQEKERKKQRRSLLQAPGEPHNVYESTEREADKIIGLSDEPGELYYLMAFSDGTADLITAKVCNEKFPQMVIRFFEENLKIQD